MSQQLKLERPASQLSLFLILFGMSFLLSGLVQILVLKINGIPMEGSFNFSDPKVVLILKWTQALSTVVVFMLPSWIFARLTTQTGRARLLGLQQAEKPSMYPIAGLGLLFSLPLAFWLGALNQQIPMPSWATSMESATEKQMEAFLALHQPLDIVLNVFIIALLPAIGEELCFRGVLQRIFIRMVRNPIGGILLTAFFFSALHFQFEGFLPRLFLGILLGAFYWYSGSLWTSILAHFVNNALQVIVVSYAPKFISENPSIPLFPTAISMVAVFAMLYYIRKESTVTYERVYGNPITHETL